MKYIKKNLNLGTEGRPSNLIEKIGGSGGGGGTLKSLSRKARTATQLESVDEWDVAIEQIFEKPYLDRMNLESWGNGNLITHHNKPMKYANGEQVPQAQQFFHGTPTMIGNKFTPWKSRNEGKPYNARDAGYYGSGTSFTSNANDAKIYRDSKDEQWNEIRPTEIQEIRDANGGIYEPEIVAVYLAPTKPLNIAVYGHELGWIRDPKDYTLILTATRRLIEKESKNKPNREELLDSFDRKVIETYANATDLIETHAAVGDDGSFNLEANDPSEISGPNSMFPEEKWRWKNRHPTRRGELNMEEFSSYIESGDFTEIAREAGYSASLIQYHPKSDKIQDGADEFDMEAYHEVIIYGPKQIKGVKNKGTFDDTENLNTQNTPVKSTQTA
jgi:hypothetical protein